MTATTVTTWTTFSPLRPGPRPRNGCLPPEQERKYTTYKLTADGGRLYLTGVDYLQSGNNHHRLGGWSEGNQERIWQVIDAIIKFARK